MPIKEATLEARIHKVLGAVFPAFADFNIIHQKYFSIRFGHHDVTVDLKEPSDRPTLATLDILLTANGQNLILLELKKEGLALNDDDRDQGLSYARLIHPMPPLVMVSNGQENRFYNTYTKEKLPHTNIDMNLIQQMVDNAFALALNDFKDAVNVLLNRQPELFSKVVTQISGKRFELISGPINDSLKPICPEFTLPRTIVTNLYKTSIEGKQLIGLIGPAFSGKTNVLYQFYSTYSKEPHNYIFYLDGADIQFSIFQQLANQFSRETNTAINKDKIREWFNNSLYNDEDGRFFLLVDNFNKELSAEVKSEIYELIDMITGTRHSIIYSMDEVSYKERSTVADRRYTNTIGTLSTLLFLNNLDDEEFFKSVAIMHERCKAVIQHGGQYASEYRQARILRQLAAFFSEIEFVEGQGTQIKAVPDYDFLRVFSQNEIYPQSVHNYYKVLASAFLLDSHLRKTFPELNIAAMNSGAISTFILKKEFSNEYIGMLSSGLVVVREYESGLSIVLPKIPELLAFYAVAVVTHAISAMIIDRKPFDEIFKFFMNQTRPFPYGDLVATGVLMNVSGIDSHLFTQIVNKLVEMKPEQDAVSPGANLLLFHESIGAFPLHLPEDIQEPGIVFEPFAYSVLSQIAGYPMEVTDDSRTYAPCAFNFYLLRTVGSWNGFIPRSDYHSLTNLPEFSVHNIDGVGEIICEKCGIIEPIVQSIQKYFFRMSEYFDALFDKAFEEKDILFLWRMFIAMSDLTTLVDEGQAKIAANFISRFKKYYKDMIC